MKCIFALPNLGAGGSERVVTLLSKEFVSMSIDVDIVLMLDDWVHYDIPSKVRVVKMNAANKSKIERIKVVRDYLINETRKNEKIVVISFHDSCLKTFQIASIGIKVEIVACERNNPYIKGKSFIKRFLANIPYVLSNKCVFQTEEAMQYYYKCIHAKSIVIENPIENIGEYKWMGSKSGKIISIGRLQEQKNQELLIEAFKDVYDKYPRYKLEIYGEGPLKEKLLNKIKSYHLDDIISLKGHTKNVFEELARSEFFVLSSDYEGMSNALLEAMVVGTPVISTDHPIGGARALIVNNQNGLLTSVGNKEELVCAMRKIIENPDLAQKISDNASKTAANMSSEKIANKWKRFLHF